MTTYHTVDRIGEYRAGLQYTHQIRNTQKAGSNELIPVPVSRHGIRYVPMDIRNNNTMLEGIFEMVRAQHFPCPAVC